MIDFFRILGNDYWHYKTSDETCSRCRQKISDDDVPLRLWPEERREYMLIYCGKCLDESFE